MKRQFVFHLIRIFLGVLFVFSALAKLYTIDNFELYIFSQQLFGFDVSTVVARVVISLELALGLLFLTNLYFKAVYKVTLYLMLSFSLFLAYKLIFSSSENCNCFGNLIVFKPAESLLKNFIIIVLLLFIKNNSGTQVRFKKIFFALVLTFSLIFPVIFSPPDIIYRKIYSINNNRGDEEQIQLSDSTLNIAQGKKVLAFFSQGCKYCVLAAHKISIIADKTNTRDDIYYVFFGDERNMDGFWNKSQSQKFRYSIIPFKEIVAITDGRLPSIFFVENGYIKQKSGYRDLTEEQFKTFFGK